MNIMNYTRRDESWQPNLPPGPRDDVLARMLETLCDADFYTVNEELTKESVLQALVDREKRQSTAIGEGIAFPHARLEGLSKAVFTVATLPEPVDFDGHPVRIVCLMLVPVTEPTISLKIMAQLSRLLSDAEVRRQVLDAKNRDELRNLFSGYNPSIDKPIVARDIMRPPRYSVKASDPVTTCSHLMSVNNVMAVPVVDDERRILGEISVGRLFRYGLPDFFAQLKSVSFIAEFDPFEKYFEDEGGILCSDMMEDSARVVPTEYTIMEIVFDLAIRNYPKLYVTDENGRWIGTIDKGVVLDNVINH